MSDLCRHCWTRTACRPRGLCQACYYTPAVRALYPSTSKYAGKREPTALELDRMIAERLPTMPANDEEPEAGPAGWTVPRYRTSKRRMPQRGSLGRGHH